MRASPRVKHAVAPAAIDRPDDPHVEVERLLRQIEGRSATARDLSIAEEALAGARRAGSSELAGRALLACSTAYRTVGKYKECLELAEEAVVLFQTTGDRAREGIAQYMVGASLWHERRWSHALVSLERAYAIAVETNDVIRQVRSQNVMAVILGHLGSYPRSLAAFDQALALSTAPGLETDRLLLLNNKAQTLLNRARTSGHPDASIRYGAEAYAVLMPEGMDLTRVWAPTYLRGIRDTAAQCLLVGRDAPEALRLFQENLSLATEMGDEGGIANARIGISEALLNLGDASAAVRGCREVLSEFSARLGPDDLVRSHLTLSSALSALGQHAEALNMYKKYHELFRHASQDIAEDYARNMEVILELEKSKAEALAFRRLADELRVAQASVESASRAKSEFFSNMSHELRTPLNAIIGFADIMRGEVFGPLPARYRSYIEDIHRSGHHLLELIAQLLDLAKSEAGRMELFEETVDLDAIIADSMTIVREAAKAGHVRISEYLPTNLLLTADPLRLRQCFINVLANAVKFTLPGGTVTVRALIDADDLRVEISDTGVGLAPEDIPKAFDRFGQGGNARAGVGTGLGLPLTKQLIELHGGKVDLNSVKDVGTTVILKLPASRIVAAASIKLG